MGSSLWGADDQGAAWLVRGPIAGVRTLAAVGQRVESGGPEAQGHFGSVVAGVGDVDLDTYDDVVIGASEENGNRCSDATCLESGRAWVVKGGDPFPAATRVVSGEFQGQRMGHAVAAGGDLDGDGRPDLVIGTNERLAGGRGTAYVLLCPVSSDVFTSDGTAELTIRGESYPDASGRAVAAVDGLVFVGCAFCEPNGAGSGQVYVVDGSQTGEVALGGGELARLVGEKGAGAGEALAAGDVDGDRVGDILVVSTGGVPRVDLVTGPFSGTVLLGTESAASFRGEFADQNITLAPPADFDGDELPDLAFGVGAYGGTRGRVYVFFGSRL